MCIIIIIINKEVNSSGLFTGHDGAQVYQVKARTAVPPNVYCPTATAVDKMSEINLWAAGAPLHRARCTRTKKIAYIAIALTGLAGRRQVPCMSLVRCLFYFFLIQKRSAHINKFQLNGRCVVTVVCGIYSYACTGHACTFDSTFQWNQIIWCSLRKKL